VLVAEHLGATQPNFTSTAAALAPVVGVMAQHLLSIGAWGTSAGNATLTMSYPVRWQLYGSGPRLPWEWVTAAVLVVVLVALVFGFDPTLWSRIRSGEWAELAGMLALANGSGRIGALEGSIGGVMGRKAESATLYMRRKVGRERIEITEVGGGRPVGKDKMILCEFHL